MPSRPKNKRAAGQSVGRVRQLVRKGRLREAVKEARTLFRKNPSEENRAIFAEALLSRAEELSRREMPDQARKLAEELRQLPSLEASVAERAKQLLIRLGLLDAARDLARRTGGSEEELDAAAADRAVRNGTAGEPNEEAEAVWSALHAVEAEDDETAWRHAQAIPRRSRFAPWKLFIRGLLAFYRGDRDQVAANWDRLERDRAPGRIAATLRSIRGFEASGEQVGASARLLEKKLQRPPLLRDLLDLRKALTEEDWKAARQTLKTLLSSAETAEGDAFKLRLTEALYGTLLDAAARAVEVGDRLGEIPRILKELEPLPSDPKWSRFWALVYEKGEGPFKRAREQWENYLESVPTLTILRPGDERRAQSEVLKRLCSLAVAEAKEGSDLGFGPAIDLARAHAQRAVEVCSEDTEARKTLALMHGYRGHHTQAAEVYRKLLEHDPRDTDARLVLARHHLDHGEPAEAVEQMDQARAVRPTDTHLAEMESAACVRLARRYALAGELERGRAAFDRAASAAPDSARRPSFRLKRGLFEQKVGDEARGEELVEEAREGFESAAGAAMALAIEAIRFGMPRRVQDRAFRQWRKILRGATNATAATEMADTMRGYCESGVDYEGRDGHIALLIDYLRRSARRAKYGREQLCRVCRFVERISDREEAAEADVQEAGELLAQKGRASFSTTPLFPFLAGKLEVQKGPEDCNLMMATSALAWAIMQTKAAEDEEGRRIHSQAKQMLEWIAPRQGGSFLAAMMHLGGDLVEEDVLEEPEDEEDDDEIEPGAPAEERAPKASKEKQARAAREEPEPPTLFTGLPEARETEEQ